MLEKAYLSAKLAVALAILGVVLQGSLLMRQGADILNDQAYELKQTQIALRVNTDQGIRLAAIAREDLKVATDRAQRHLDYYAVEGLRLADTKATQLNSTIQGSVLIANDRWKDTNMVAAISLDQANRSLGLIAAQAPMITGHMARMALPAGQLLDQLNSSAPMWLECDHNPDCFYNRSQGILKHTERTLGNIDLMTTRIAAPKSKGAKAWEGIKLGAIVASRFIP